MPAPASLESVRRAPAAARNRQQRRAMARLSAQPSSGNSANEGAMCNGGGSADAFIDAAAPIRRGKQQPVKKSNLVRRAHPAIEILEVRAAAQRHVLAIVHVLAAGQHVGRRAAAQVGPLFEQTHAEAGFSQRDGRGKSRQAAADHDHALRGHYFGVTAQAARAARTPFFRECSAARARRKPQSRALRCAAAARCRCAPGAQSAARLSACTQTGSVPTPSR